MSTTWTADEIRLWLDVVKDPEIPAISVVELGVVRDIVIDDQRVTVRLTPTYSGCPAMQLMEDEILACLANHGVQDRHVELVFEEPWSTDWMTEGAREKLRVSGIAPPLHTTQTGDTLVQLRRHRVIACPWCGAHDTILRSEFGSTSCKAIYSCNECRQPFDYFKAI